jgi:hypothetical protein
MAFTRPGYNNNNNKNRNRNRNRRPSGGTGNSGGGGGSGANRVYDSNGPDVKLRGTAQTIAEKYMQLGRDAHSSGDSVMAESYYQFGDHYYRLWLSAQPAGQPLQFSRRMAEEEMEDEAGEGGPEGEDDGQNPSQNGEAVGATEGGGGEASASGEDGGEQQPSDGQQQDGQQRQNRQRDFNNNNNNNNREGGRNFRQRWPRRNDRYQQGDGNSNGQPPVEGAAVDGQEPRQDPRPERQERQERFERPVETASEAASGDWEAPSFLKRPAPAPMPESADDVMVDDAPVAAAPRPRRGRPPAVKPEDAPQGD